MVKIGSEDCLRYFYCAFLALIIFILSSCQQKPNQQSLIVNIPYSEARTVILQSGWKPIPNNESDDEIGSHAIDLRNKGYVEVDDCSGTGMGYCAFHFQNDKGTFLLVTTQEAPFAGYNPELMDTDDAIVIYYGISDKIN